MQDYESFVAGKLAHHVNAGITGDLTLCDGMFPFQRDLVTWALRRGRAAIFASTGLGKTRMQLAWADVVHKHTDGRVLVLAPLAVAQQTIAEAASVGVEAVVARDASGVGPGITVTNYDRLHKFDGVRWAGVVLDECFAAGTLVDTPSGPRSIETIRVGDRIVNAIGIDVVSDVHRREVPYAVKVAVRGRVCIASPNHPFFTQRGWVGARDLRRGDHVLEAAASLPMVRTGVRSQVADVAAQSILRDILLSELANEHSGAQGESAQCGRVSETRCESVQAIRRESDRGHGGEPRAVGRAGTRQVARDARAHLSPIERDRARTFRAWGQWAWPDVAAILAAGCTWTAMASGICLVTGPTDARLPDALQARLGALRDESVYRGGWLLSSDTDAQGHRSEERRETAFARVDGIEILEPGHPELERLRSSDGKLYFHDIGATRHPSFSVSGLLVHNSSIIKHHDAKTFSRLVERFRDTPYKLCATATPAPNDFTELGTHAEFLGVCSRTEMLAEFFCHDGGDTSVWRLKGHARGAFWRWVSAWGALVRSPSDLGYEDGAYALPPLVHHEHILPLDQADVFASGRLFAEEAAGLMARRQARRSSLTRRVAECASVVNADPCEPWVVWCDLNDESEALTGAIEGAIEVRGSMDIDEKEAVLTKFADGKARVIVSKPRICGFGLNWQHAARMAFVGVTDSYEQYFQAVRREWRFGQKRDVHVHVFASEAEGAVVRNLQRKGAAAEEMAAALSAETAQMVQQEVRGIVRDVNSYNRPTLSMPEWLVPHE